MIDRKIGLSIVTNIMANMTKSELKLEIGRFIEEDPLLDLTLKIWVIRINERQLSERTLELDQKKFPGINAQLTFAPPNFFSDVIRGVKDIPFWQVATVVRSLRLAYPFYDPEYFIENHIEAVDNLEWSDELLEEKVAVTNLLLSKAEKYAFEEDMLADGYLWAIKAAEEAICLILMKKKFFSLASPTLLLNSIRQDEDLYNFYIQLIGVDILNPDLVIIALSELETLARHLYQANEKNSRSSWILGSFVSINQVERKINNILESAGNIDPLELQNRFEDVLAEFWHALWLLAQDPKNKITPLDPWVVGLAWKWLISNGDHYGLSLIIKKIRSIIETSQQ